MNERSYTKNSIVSVLKNLFLSVMILIMAAFAGCVFKALHMADRDIIMLYIIAVISVVGIPQEEKEKVFDMFCTVGSRLSDSRRSLGPGLALCRSIISSHEGTVSVSDNTPSGTVVSFTLPIGEVDLNE